MLNMNRTQFSRYMDIPLRTLEEWEAEQILRKKGIELAEEYKQK